MSIQNSFGFLVTAHAHHSNMFKGHSANTYELYFRSINISSGRNRKYLVGTQQKLSPSVGTWERYIYPCQILLKGNSLIF